MTRHLSRPTLQALLECRPGPGAQASAHLATCPRCKARLRRLSPRRAGTLLDDIEELTPLVEFLEHRGPEVLRRAERDFPKACRLARSLPRLTVARRREAVLASDLPATPLAVGILTMLPGLVQDAPEDVVNLCRVALEVLDRECPSAPSRSRAGLMADLEANLANALRMLAKISEARCHMTCALALADQTPDVQVRGEVFMYASLVARDGRDFETALSFAGQAKRLFRRAGNSRMTKRLSRIETSVLFLQGDFPQVIARVKALLRDPSLEPRARFAATFLLIKALVLDGSPFEAASRLPRLTELTSSSHDSTAATQLAWLRGLVVGSVHDPEVGERLMRRARDAYLEKGVLYDAALVTLDMAMVRYEAGQHKRAARHAADIVQAFSSSGDRHREALAALRCFQASVGARDDARRRYEELQLYLPLARRDPAYCYRPGSLGSKVSVQG